MTAKKLIWRLILSNPDISVDEIAAALTDQHLRVSDLLIATVRSEFIAILDFLQEEGLIDPMNLTRAWPKRPHFLDHHREEEKWSTSRQAEGPTDRTPLWFPVKPREPRPRREPDYNGELPRKKKRPFRRWNFNG
jgi:hypothetical protein